MGGDFIYCLTDGSGFNCTMTMLASFFSADTFPHSHTLGVSQQHPPPTVDIPITCLDGATVKVWDLTGKCLDVTDIVPGYTGKVLA